MFELRELWEKLKHSINCSLYRHEWKEEGVGINDKIVCFCKYCGKIITVTKRVNEREKQAQETKGEPYLESIWYYIPYYKLVRQYAGETVLANTDYELAKQIQKKNTMNELIKEYMRNEKQIKKQSGRAPKT